MKLLNTTVKTNIRVVADVDSSGYITLKFDSGKIGAVSKTVKTKTKTKTVKGKAIQCFGRGEVKPAISGLEVGGVRKIKTALSDSAIRKNGYSLGMTLSVKKSGFNQYTLERTS